MAFFSDPRRMQIVMETMRGHDSMVLRELYDELDGIMDHKTAWKAFCCLKDEGVAYNTEELSERGHKRFRIFLEEWYRLDDEQRERMITALERIADRLAAPAPVFNGSVGAVNTGVVVYEAPKQVQRETKVVEPEERK